MSHASASAAAGCPAPRRSPGQLPPHGAIRKGGHTPNGGRRPEPSQKLIQLRHPTVNVPRPPGASCCCPCCVPCPGSIRVCALALTYLLEATMAVPSEEDSCHDIAGSPAARRLATLQQPPRIASRPPRLIRTPSTRPLQAQPLLPRCRSASPDRSSEQQATQQPPPPQAAALACGVNFWSGLVGSGPYGGSARVQGAVIQWARRQR